MESDIYRHKFKMLATEEIKRLGKIIWKCELCEQLRDSVEYLWEVCSKAVDKSVENKGRKEL